MTQSEGEFRDDFVAERIQKLPAPAPRDGFFEDLRQDLNAESQPEPRPLARQRYRRALLATAAVSALVGAIAGASVSLAANDADAPTRMVTSADAVYFASAEGWNTISSNIMVGDESSPVAWAATIPFQAEADYGGFPDRTVSRMSPGSVVISVLGPRPYKREAGFPRLENSPLIVSGEDCLSSAYEGQPRPYVSLCPLDRRLGEDAVLNVLVWIGGETAGDQPSQALIDSANEELARLVLPAEDS